MAANNRDIEEFKAQQDSSDWQFTEWVQVGHARWQKQAEKFWRVPAEIKNQRYTTCQACEHFVSKTTQCRQCQCFMGIKTWLGGFGCPEGKWPAEKRD